MSLWEAPQFPENSYYSAAAVATDHVRCSEIGRDIMIKGGNAVEAAIAVMVCLGIVNPMSSGLGGGHFMTLYNATTKDCTVIDARETAPSAAFKHMFDSNPSESETGWKAIAVPGELHGLWTEYKNFGGIIPWPELIEPTIDLMKAGIPVSQALENAIEVEQHTVRKDKALMRDFLNPDTGKFFKTGDILRNRKELRRTLEILAKADDPVEEFYRGKLMEQFVDEFKNNDAIITSKDFKNYRAIVRNHSEVVVTQLNGRYICGPPPPSSSAVTQSIIKIMDDYFSNVNESAKSSASNRIHYFLETAKFAYGMRGELGDIAFVPEAAKISREITSENFVTAIKRKIDSRALPLSEYRPKFASASDHGTSSFVVIDSQGNAVSATTTVNFLFGAGVASESTGIIWNSNMNDFSIPNGSNFYGFPPAPANFIEPGKRPMSSISPLIVIDKATDRVELVVGAAGGSRIITTVSSIATKVLHMGFKLREALNSPRLHNQLLPNFTLYETHLPEDYVKDLGYRGHLLKKTTAISDATAIFVHGKGVYASGDYRQGVESQPAGY